MALSCLLMEGWTKDIWGFVLLVMLPLCRGNNVVLIATNVQKFYVYTFFVGSVEEVRVINDILVTFIGCIFDEAYH